MGKLKYEYNHPNAKMEHCKLARELQESIGKGKHMTAGYRIKDGTNQGAEMDLLARDKNLIVAAKDLLARGNKNYKGQEGTVG